MTKGRLTWLGLAVLAASAAAQTGTVPLDNGTPPSGFTNSNITVSNGNVGIGTTSPISLLDVIGIIHASGNVNPVTSAQGAYLGWNALTGGTGETDFINNQGGGSGGFAFMNVPSSGSPRTTLMYVNGGGNVGIGTTNPQYTLDINGLFRAQGSGSVVSGNGGYIPAGLSFVDTSYSDSTHVNQWSIWKGNTWIQGLGFMRYSAANRCQAGGICNLDLMLYDNGDVAVGENNALTAKQGGNVGIGTTNPASLLSVGASSQFQVNASGAVTSGSIVSSGPVGIGVSPQYTLDVAGQVHASQAIYASGGITFGDGSSLSSANTLCGGDYAESVDVSDDRTKYGPGDVMIADPDHDGKFLKSAEPYSTGVLGVYSTKPGAIGRRQSTPKSPNEIPMAMIGIVPTKVSAENGAIKPGDLLVTSATPGYAMKGTDRGLLSGAVIGKSLGHLDAGKGMIEVAVTLQ